MNDKKNYDIQTEKNENFLKANQNRLIVNTSKYLKLLMHRVYKVSSEA